MINFISRRTDAAHLLHSCKVELIKMLNLHLGGREVVVAGEGKNKSSQLLSAAYLSVIWCFFKGHQDPSMLPVLALEPAGEETTLNFSVWCCCSLIKVPNGSFNEDRQTKWKVQFYTTLKIHTWTHGLYCHIYMMSLDTYSAKGQVLVQNCIYGLFVTRICLSLHQVRWQRYQTCHKSLF